MKTLHDLLMQAIADEVKDELTKEAAAQAVAPSAAAPAPVAPAADLERFSKLAQDLRKLAAGPSADETVRNFTNSVKAVGK